MSGVFAEGEKALFIDSKQRRYLIQLNKEGEFHSHAGFVPHTSVIGTLPGQPVESTKGSKYMLRYGAHITGLELREDFMNRAKANVRSFLGEEALSRYNVSLGDSYEATLEGSFDRVMLDLPEPWQVVPRVQHVLEAGGLLVAYTPSISQAVQVRESMGKGWVDQRTLEVLHRTWHIEGMAVRPDHRMVAHTAFLTVGRWIGSNL